MIRAILIVLLSIVTAHSACARQLPPALPDTPSVACLAAIAATEQREAIPQGLLGAIGIAETGRLDPALGRVAPWPWSINVAGEDHVYMTKAEAIAAVQAYQAQGVQSIDVGCVQVNLMWHPDAFATLDAAFEPATNVAYGGRFLKALFSTFGAWDTAAGAYHSQTPELADPYRQRVMALWPGAKNLPVPLQAPVALNTNADVYGAWPPPGKGFAAMPPAGFAFRCCDGAQARSTVDIAPPHPVAGHPYDADAQAKIATRPARGRPPIASATKPAPTLIPTGTAATRQNVRASGSPASGARRPVTG